MKISRLPSWCKDVLNSLGLIEIMVIVAVISILAAMLIPAFVAAKERQSQNHSESAKHLSVGDSVFIKGINTTGVINSGNGYYFDILVVGKNGEPTSKKF